MVHDLTHSPAAVSVGRVQLGIREAGDGRTHAGRRTGDAVNYVRTIRGIDRGSRIETSNRKAKRLRFGFCL
jgi:hypothetical protein